MGQRAIYVITEDGKNNSFFAFWGANALSPLLRLLQAKEIQEQLPERQSIAHIFEHLDYGGVYVNPRHDNPADMFCDPIADVDLSDRHNISGRHNVFGNSSEIEMLVRLDLDGNNCLLEYNRNCPWYTSMNNYIIPIDTGLRIVEKLLMIAEEQGIDSFGQLLYVYNKATGIDKALENARASQRLDEYLNSDEVKADRERFLSMYGSPGEPEDENEMEV